MAIDANIIIFERMKEEKAEGHQAEVVIRNSFAHAWTAIRDGQLTTLFGAIVLFWFGTSSVEGFALVLGMGTLMSLLSSMLVSRFFMYSIYAK
jgi:SecD/SecF fusion protein